MYLQRVYLMTILALTLMFALTWQFAQFVLLLQSCVLFGLAVLGVVDKDKVGYNEKIVALLLMVSVQITGYEAVVAPAAVRGVRVVPAVLPAHGHELPGVQLRPRGRLHAPDRRHGRQVQAGSRGQLVQSHRKGGYRGHCSLPAKHFHQGNSLVLL